MNQHPLLVVEDVAERLHCSRRTVHELTRTFAIPHFKPPGCRRCYFRAEWLQAWEEGAKNPVGELERGDWPQRTDTEAGYFRNDEVDRLFAPFEYRLYYVICALALLTGMRIGELRGLTWGRVDLRVGRLTVVENRPSGAKRTKRPKSGRKRFVDLLPEARALLREWWERCGRPSGDTLVFVGLGKGSFVSDCAVRENLERAMVEAGIPPAHPDEPEKRTFHSFRHTFAKRALERGVGLEWLSRALGQHGHDHDRAA